MAVNAAQYLAHVFRRDRLVGIFPGQAEREERERARVAKLHADAKASGLSLSDYKVFLRKKLGLSRRQFKKQFGYASTEAK